MDELIARIEAASGPDRELDARIAIAFDLAQGNVMVGVDGWVINSLINPNPYRAPSFTGSLDAALTLVPEGEGFELVTMHGTPIAFVGSGEKIDWCDANCSGGANPALALCAAALRARAA